MNNSSTSLLTVSAANITAANTITSSPTTAISNKVDDNSAAVFDDEQIINVVPRRSMKQVVIDDTDDDELNDFCDNSAEDCGKSKNNGKKRDMKRFSLRQKKRVDGLCRATSGSNGSCRRYIVTCLICKEKFAFIGKKSVLAYYICDNCLDTEKGYFTELEYFLMQNCFQRKMPRTRLKSDASTKVKSRDCSLCKHQSRVNNSARNEEKEVQKIQACWQELRQNIRQMYRDGLDKNLLSLKGRKFDIEKIKRSVALLFKRDPHQLYKRLESIGHEYVMNLKSDDLWQILVAPQVIPDLIKLYECGADEATMEVERAKLFIRSLLDRFSCQQETVRNMSSFLSVLDDEYLSLFGVNWKIVNHHIFDRVIYQDDLLINYLPNMEKVLKCELIVADDTEEERIARARIDASRTDIPPGAMELIQSFRVFHNLMITSREIFKKASANFTLFVEQQNIIYQITQKAKCELLEEDKEFFKNQRKLLRDCASRKNSRIWKFVSDLCDEENDLYNDNDSENWNSENDNNNFSERLHIENGPSVSTCIGPAGKIDPSLQCKDCLVKHCSCDECRISHAVTCGLFSENDDHSSNFFSSESSSDFSDEDSKNSGDEYKKKNEKKKKYLDRTRLQTAIAFFTLHDHSNPKEIAWGDWQVPYCFEPCLEDRSPKTSFLSVASPFNFGLDVSDNEALLTALKSKASKWCYNIQETIAGNLCSGNATLQKGSKPSDIEDKRKNCSNRPKINEQKVVEKQELQYLEKSPVRKDIDFCRKAKKTSNDLSEKVDSNSEMNSHSSPFSEYEENERGMKQVNKDDARLKICCNNQFWLEPQRSFLKQDLWLESQENRESLEISNLKNHIFSDVEISETAKEWINHELKKLDAKALEHLSARLLLAETNPKMTSDDLKRHFLNCVKHLSKEWSDDSKELDGLDATINFSSKDLNSTISSESLEKKSFSKSYISEDFAGIQGSNFESLKVGKVDNFVAIKEKMGSIDNPSNEANLSDHHRRNSFIEKKIRCPSPSCRTPKVIRMEDKRYGYGIYEESATEIVKRSNDGFVDDGTGKPNQKFVNINCNEHEQNKIEADYRFDTDVSDGDDEDDESEEWSECDSTIQNHPHRHHSCDSKNMKRGRNGRIHHCDCCYCEVFGHSNNESLKFGRAPQIRERLRLKLKKRSGKEENAETMNKMRQDGLMTKLNPAERVNADSVESNMKIPLAIAPIDEILDYINEKDVLAAQVAANRAAKRARQKQRKQEEKERLENERRKAEERKKAMEALAVQKKRERQAAQEKLQKQKAFEAEERKKKAAEARAVAIQKKKESRKTTRQHQSKEFNASQDNCKKCLTATKNKNCEKKRNKVKNDHEKSRERDVSETSDRNYEKLQHNGCEFSAPNNAKSISKSGSAPGSAVANVSLGLTVETAVSCKNPINRFLDSAFITIPQNPTAVCDSSPYLCPQSGNPSSNFGSTRVFSGINSYFSNSNFNPGLPSDPHILPPPPGFKGVDQSCYHSQTYHSESQYSIAHCDIERSSLNSAPNFCCNKTMVNNVTSISHVHLNPASFHAGTASDVFSPTGNDSSLNEKFFTDTMQKPTNFIKSKDNCNGAFPLSVCSYQHIEDRERLTPNYSNSSSPSFLPAQRLASEIVQVQYMFPEIHSSKLMNYNQPSTDLVPATVPVSLFPEKNWQFNNTNILSFVQPNMEDKDFLQYSTCPNESANFGHFSSAPISNSPDSYCLNGYTIPLKNNAQVRLPNAPISHLANYESETRNLAAAAQLDPSFSILSSTNNTVHSPLKFMNFFDAYGDSYRDQFSDETLQFLDAPYIQFLNPEQRKRQPWETEQSDCRHPLKELPRLEPENEAGAVFYFKPLV